MSDPGERAARFRVMYEAHYTDIRAFTTRRLGSPHEVADAVAEVFTTAWRRLDKIPPPPQDRLWIFGVARRVVKDHRRSAMRRGSLLQRLVSQERPTLSMGAVPEDPVDDHLLAAIGALRPSDRDALVLVMWDGLSHAEAAEVLGCSVNAVGIRIHRAKRRIREALMHGPQPVAEPAPTPFTPKTTRS